MHGLSSSYASLDASRPWLIYWMTHALELLDSPYKELHASCVDTLSRCQHPNGGFGGGVQQFPHTAPTYAACLALVDIGTPEALESVDRCKLYSFLWRVKDSSGGFRVQEDGEMDTRGLYTALAVASLFDILTPELARGKFTL
jgi:protein farnesyltransferase subunit beta